MDAWRAVRLRARSRIACAAIAFLPGAMSFFRAGLAVATSRDPKSTVCASAPLLTRFTKFRSGMAYREGNTRLLAMVSGGNISSAYDYHKQSTRFHGAFLKEEVTDDSKVVPVTLIEDKAGFEEWLSSQPARAKSWIRTIGFNSHKPGRVVLVPSMEAVEGDDCSLAEVAFCLGEGEKSQASPFSLCSLRDKLPTGSYQVRAQGNGALSNPDEAALSWALASYSFDRYKSKPMASTNGEGVEDGKKESNPRSRDGSRMQRLVWPNGANKRRVVSAASSTFLVRDLITTPCEDMGPQHLEEALKALGSAFGATTQVVRGQDLLTEGDNYPMIHAVGRAAGKNREPRLLDLRWSLAENLPKVTLVGKGVCFDTGGLDIKSASTMLMMKKDMGGAAQVLGLAGMIMAHKLPIQLRVLIPAVENAISSEAFRPGDVITARDGKTSEIGNTDAEGRLVLADALVAACSEVPDLVIDCATLTGAARTALGTDIPAVFCNDEKIVNKLLDVSARVYDQVWRLPLWEGYREQLSSKIADLKNVGTGGLGGAITAALYLESFIGTHKKPEDKGDADSSSEQHPNDKNKIPWIHVDFNAFNRGSKPGRPEGGEAQGMRALFALLEDMFVGGES